MERLDGKKWMLARDGDMTTCLDEAAENGEEGLGFMGSDRFYEESINWWYNLKSPSDFPYNFLPLVKTDIRFALATIPEKVDRLKGKLAAKNDLRVRDHLIESGDSLVIATTYPRTISGIINGVSHLSDIPLKTVDVDGCVEAAPAMFERVDAVFDVVNTGKTLKKNRLEIVWDNLGKISVGAIWRQNESS